MKNIIKIASNRSENLIENDCRSQNDDIYDNDIIIKIIGSPKGFGGDLKETPNLKDLNSQLENSLERKRSITPNTNLPNDNVNLFFIKCLKNTRIVGEIKDKVNDFLSEFNNYFNDNIFNKYTNHIENLMNEKYKKHLEICNYYDNQIKEMEFLLVGNNN